jgi:hypothetical protein
MNKVTIVVLVLLICNLIGGISGAATTLASEQKTAYTIALAADAIPAERTAAEQLQKYLQQVTGASFPLQRETAVKADAPQILVGAGARVKSLLPTQDWNALGHDGIVLKTVGQKLILAGGRPRGTLYAVFQFLEDEVGCKWWTPSENSIPSQSTLKVRAQNVVYIPAFSYREHFTNAVREHPEFATLLRENGHFQTQSTEWGGHYNMLGFVHTFATLLPLEKYFKEHPEWYTDPSNGHLPCSPTSPMPDAQHTELDLSNPQVLEEVTKNALEWIAKNPTAGYISISQNDNRDGYCRCPKCAAMTAAEGSPSGPLLAFVNQVAARIHQQHPDFLVETLAYYFTETPPKTIRPAKNVVIRLAPIDSDFGHPLDSEWNQETRAKIKAWAEISPQLFVWNYASNFRANMLPHPNWDGLAKDLRFFADHKVIGVFEQGDAYTNGVGDFVQLRAWLIGKLLWNPKLDQNRLIDEFLKGYYGAGAPYLRQYIDLVQSSYLAEKRPLSTFNTDLFFFTPDVMNQAIRLFEQATHAVQANGPLAQRVRRERLSLELARLYQFQSLKRAAQRQGEVSAQEKELLGNLDAQQAMKELVASARAFGIVNFKEGISFESTVPQLLSMNPPAVELPDFARGLPPVDVIDLQAGEFGLHGRGTICDLEPDANASGGLAASIIGATSDWAIQADLHRFLVNSDSGKWHVYALARAEVKAGQTPENIALQCGVYDSVNRVRVSDTYIPAAQIRGDTYQRIDLGVNTLNGGMFIWFAPVSDLAVKKVYVERILLIREK